MKPPIKSYTGDDPYIFISYAHKDSADVYPALSAFFEKGERIWYDEGIKPGSDWAAEIGVHIDNCAMVLWFVSKKAAARTNVTREIQYAKSRQKPILIIYIENTELAGDNAADFANLQNIHMENCTTYGDLADKVKELAKEKGLGTNTGADTSMNSGSVSDKEIRLEHKRSRKQRTVRIAGICGAILVVLVLFFTLCFAQIPHVAGMKLDDAVKAIDSSKFNHRETEAYSDTVPTGEIISQSPLGGKYGFRFTPIILEVSLGAEPQMTTVPLVIGDEVDFGISKILKNALYFAISAVPTQVKAAGLIDAQDIRAETSVPVETKLGVDVNASSPEEARKLVIDAIIKAGGAGLFTDSDGNPLPDGALSAETARAVLERIFVIEGDVVILGNDVNVEGGRIVLPENDLLNMTQPSVSEPVTSDTTPPPPGTASNMDLLPLSDKYFGEIPISNLNVELRDDIDIGTNKSEGFVGYARLSFDLVTSDLSDDVKGSIRMCLIWTWGTGFNPDEIPNLCQAAAALWHNAGVFNNVADSQSIQHVINSFPAYKEDLGKNLKVLLVLIDGKGLPIGYCIADVTVPTAVTS
jgi:hypothetical protein